MKKILIGLAMVGVAGLAYAQTNQMPSGPTNAPAGTSGPNSGTTALPESSTNTAKPGALDSANTSAAEAAARSKIEGAGFSDVKGLTRTMDGTWSGRAVKGGVETAVSMDPAGNVTTQ
jgi:putative membrane protein